MPMASKRKAVAMQVSDRVWSYAVKRVKQVKADIQIMEAIKQGAYWFWPRAKRSDAASDELMLLMRQYWHDPEVSRQIGNSANRDMWKPSKSPTAESRSRRQITEPGGGDAVYAKFLKSAGYRNFKSQQDETFTDPGRTLFLWRRCKCLILPVMEPCACKIHSQQVLYIEALAGVNMASHGECQCRWCSVGGGSKWQETWKHLGTFSDAIACQKVNLREGDPKDDVGYLHWKPECCAFTCKECGFGGPGGIPNCERLENSEKEVQWKVFEDVITVPASPDGKT